MCFCVLSKLLSVPDKHCNRSNAGTRAYNLKYSPQEHVITTPSLSLLVVLIVGSHASFVLSAAKFSAIPACCPSNAACVVVFCRFLWVFHTSRITGRFHSTPVHQRWQYIMGCCSHSFVYVCLPLVVSPGTAVANRSHVTFYTSTKFIIFVSSVSDHYPERLYTEEES